MTWRLGVSSPTSNPTTISDAAIMVSAIVIVLAVLAGYAEVAYGDWRCALAECRVVVHRDVKTPEGP